MNNQVEAVEEPLSLSSDIKRACELLEKLQKSKYCGEVPATKLAALQKVLQSDFLTAVREVYEHIYETVDIEGREMMIVMTSLSGTQKDTNRQVYFWLASRMASTLQVHSNRPNSMMSQFDRLLVSLSYSKGQTD